MSFEIIKAFKSCDKPKQLAKWAYINGLGQQYTCSEDTKIPTAMETGVEYRNSYFYIITSFCRGRAAGRKLPI